MLDGDPEHYREFATEYYEDDEGESEDEPHPLDAKARRRIEALFAKAGQDISKAMELKRELDRLGVFKTYEDRFLDLFKKAE